ncbi:MAG: dihydrolipoyl dehydrogenase [Arenicellales bacterium]|nr:dihydrolipoyl dehydrogenase [Arenicellales bacterium]
MSNTPITVNVPDIGDFRDVDIIEVLIAPGDTIDIETPLITLETDKATMDVPSPVAGKVIEVLTQVGGQISEGDPVAIVGSNEPAALSPPPTDATPTTTPPEAPAPNSASSVMTDDVDSIDLVVLGSGPGGYTAAFRAADLGLKVALVERYPTLGGVCLNVGCIPSKALLHAARVIEETREMRPHGIDFGEPVINVAQLREWKEKVVGQLTGGLASLAKKRRVEVITGIGEFTSSHSISIRGSAGERTVRFSQAIIAAGSQAVALPGLPEDPRVIDSTGALALDHIPDHLLVIGGGIIGLEMATVYRALGSQVSIVEMSSQLIPGADPDLVKPLAKRLAKQCDGIYLNTRVISAQPQDDGLLVSFAGDNAPIETRYDAVLVAVGRTPNGHHINAPAAGVAVNEQGFITVNAQQRTNIAHIFAIGDIVGQPMLAHKASHEGKVAAEVAVGHKSGFDARVIPSVAYTDPEIAWAGLTETEAKDRGIEYEKGVFPWAASGRALSLSRSEGFTKLLFEPVTQRILGGSIVGSNAGELIAEIGLAIEMDCVAQDISLTVHPHPTLSETTAFAAEAFEGTITDLYLPRKR